MVSGRKRRPWRSSTLPLKKLPSRRPTPGMRLMPVCQNAQSSQPGAIDGGASQPQQAAQSGWSSKPSALPTTCFHMKTEV